MTGEGDAFGAIKVGDALRHGRPAGGSPAAVDGDAADLFSGGDTKKRLTRTDPREAPFTRMGASSTIKIDVLHHATTRTLPEVESQLN